MAALRGNVACFEAFKGSGSLEASRLLRVHENTRYQLPLTPIKAGLM